MSDHRLTYIEKWFGQHRGVNYEVSLEHREPTAYTPAEWWCHYIVLAEQQLPEDERDRYFIEPEVRRLAEHSPERVLCNYYGGSPIADLDWHGGITFYDIVCAVSGHRVLRAGCDYQHSWDMGHRYTRDYVAMQARRTIDSLHERVALLAPCSIYGHYHLASEMVAHSKSGRLVYPGCEERWAKECAAKEVTK